jgi:hypothetical protein
MFYVIPDKLLKVALNTINLPITNFQYKGQFVDRDNISPVDRDNISPVDRQFSYIVVVNLIGGGNLSTQKKLPTCHT